jgi:hypothetical protein
MLGHHYKVRYLDYIFNTHPNQNRHNGDIVQDTGHRGSRSRYRSPGISFKIQVTGKISFKIQVTGSRSRYRSPGISFKIQVTGDIVQDTGHREDLVQDTGHRGSRSRYRSPGISFKIQVNGDLVQDIGLPLGVP